MLPQINWACNRLILNLTTVEFCSKFSWSIKSYLTHKQLEMHWRTISTVATADALVRKHQAISIYSAN